MNPLDDLISSNPEHFNNEEPLPGHFLRFDQRLDKTFGKKPAVVRSMVLKIAVMLAVGLLLTYLAIRESEIISNRLGFSLAASKYPELIEAEKYYTLQMDMYYSKIRNLNFENDETQKKQILDELSNMDRQVTSLKHDLMINPENERVIHAIINYYQVKIEFMDMILTRTQQSNHTIL